MNIYAISGAATIALASTILFVLLAWCWQALTQPLRGIVHFPACIMAEAAQRFRDEIELLRRKQGIFLASVFVFAAVFVIAYVLAPQTLFDDMPPWELLIVLAILSAGGAYAGYRNLQVAIRRRRLVFVRDANIATGQGLQKLAGSQNRVFHEVPCAKSVIAHVVVGLHGVYAVHVVARRPGRHNKLRLQSNRLLFAPGRHSISLSEFTDLSERLARELRKALKIALRVRTVLAVPGWEIEQQAGDASLVVNERSLVMLRGWTHPDDHLMHEDVEKLQALLTERCTRSNPRHP
ncbi:MAG: hypothetical protein ACREQ8_11010 [Woeseiaceae bacterium]